ncbi:hypothetical protein PENTCL1PPCAC_25573, partial [Pristionchus entomophagus]
FQMADPVQEVALADAPNRPIVDERGAAPFVLVQMPTDVEHRQNAERILAMLPEAARQFPFHRPAEIQNEPALAAYFDRQAGEVADNLAQQLEALQLPPDAPAAIGPDARLPAEREAAGARPGMVAEIRYRCHHDPCDYKAGRIGLLARGGWINLTSHSDIHMGGRLRCSGCGDRFPQLPEMTLHIDGCRVGEAPRTIIGAGPDYEEDLDALTRRCFPTYPHPRNN